jgi:uncharacterized protein with GYD domain
MPIYILLSTLSGEGVESLKRNPSRLQQVNVQVEAMGARILDQWAVLGPFDFVTVVEAPDAVTVARIAVEIGARGSTKIQSMPAIPVSTFLDAISTPEAYE